MKTLIIFTKLYPYAKTEAFLESEILVLSNSFDRIVICPAYKHSFVRKVPVNVEIDNTFCIDKKKRSQSIFKSIINGVLFKSFVYNINKIKNISDIRNIVRYAGYEVYYEDIYEKSNFFIDDNCIVYSYWFGHFVNSLLKIKEKKKLKFKLITRAHRWDIYEEGVAIFPYRQDSVNKLDMLYSISLDGKKYIQQKYGNNDKIKVSRLGVVDRHRISQASRNNEIVILSVSQITKRKRILLLLESVILYAEKNKEVKVTWIHFGVGDLENIIKDKISKIISSNLVIDLKGYVNNKDIFNFYSEKAIDVFVNLSESEGVPVSIMEAQSFGIPVIATNVGGTGEIVDNENGVLLSSNPSLKEVCEALDFVFKKSFSRDEIKNMWNKKSNAEKNYALFTKELKKL